MGAHQRSTGRDPKNLSPQWGVLSYYCCKCKLLEISRLLGHADVCTVELSRTFYQFTKLLCNATEIILL